MLALVIGLFWLVTQHQDLLPVTFVDVHPLSRFRRTIGGLVILTLGGAALWLLWRRQRSLLDQWLVVALSALLLEVLLASVLSAGRYNFAWYAGRFYQLVTATVVMVVLLAEMTQLYAGLARSNTMLQRDARCCSVPWRHGGASAMPDCLRATPWPRPSRTSSSSRSPP